MKKLARKNQIIVAGLALMIAAAGYLNYSGKLFPEKTDKMCIRDRIYTACLIYMV